MVRNDTPCDSRQYRFGYALKVASDIPRDFPVPIPVSEWSAAIFMPGDTQDSWRLPAYPPRIYVLTRDTLAIYPHPSSSESGLVTLFRELIEVESQKALLYGELGFHTRTGSRSFRYNAVQQKQVNSFLRVLRSLWLPAPGIALPLAFGPHEYSTAGFGCWYALREELDPKEQFYRICFQPVLQWRTRARYFARTHTLPAHLFVVTNRRVMLISEETGEANDPYGIRMRCAAVSSLTFAEVSETITHSSLSIGLEHGGVWEFSFALEQAASMASMLEMLNALLYLAIHGAKPSATGFLEGSSTEQL